MRTGVVIQDEAASLKTQLACLSEKNKRFEQQHAALEGKVQSTNGGNIVSDTVSGSGEALALASADLPGSDMGSDAKALNALLFTSKNERDQLATVLSASEERGSSLKSQLNVALKQVSESEQVSYELRARLDAAEVRGCMAGEKCIAIIFKQS